MSGTIERPITIPFRLESKYGMMALAFEGDKVRISDEAAPMYPEYTDQIFDVVKAPWKGTNFTVRDAQGNILKGSGRIFSSVR